MSSANYEKDFEHHEEEESSGFLKLKTERKKSNDTTLCEEYLKLVESCWPPLVTMLGPKTFAIFVERVTGIPALDDDV